MSVNDVAAIKKELERTTRLQADAADPAASVWVSANAGTGKTHVLTMRVLRLLLADTPPERILCLTYTKAAAAEMSKRVFESLSKWVMLEEADLEHALLEFLGREPDATEIARARTLFTRATETPGGLSVQTIHAFAERLLQRFPLEAGVTPGFSILDDETSRKLMREAIDRVIGAAAGNRASPLGRALETAIAYAADDRFDEILADALREREWLEAAVRWPAAQDGAPEGLDAVEDLLREHFAVRQGISRAAIEAEGAVLLAPRELMHVRDVLRGGGSTDNRMADKVSDALATGTDRARMDALSDVFLKSDGTPRDKFLTNGLKAKNPEIEPLLSRAQSRFLSLWAEQQGAAVVEATMALVRLADAVQQRYTDAKVRRAALDFEDLIARTKNLLSTRESAEWVLYKLDNGLDHILVDESQDTSPSQWRVVEAMANEFFSGDNARAETVRTLFAVGDEKQSIYSFQGAAPEMFSAMGDRFADIGKNANVTWRQIPLTLSFRTVAPVLQAVDRVFADTQRTPGVTPAPHAAKRAGQGGVVEIWPTEKHEDIVPADAWSPLEEQSAEPPVVRLANRIADTIKGWLESGEKLASTGRAIEPGDVLILVRKRQPFAGPMVQALKARGIPVAGADRMRLTEQIAVQDMLSLGDFLTLPEDDLALAEVLKSPIFALDDADLTDLAYERKGTLWKALLDKSEENPRYVEAAATLKRWRKAADFRPPFEFFADLLDRDRVRAKLIARLGPDAADPLDEFLNLALTYDDSAPPSLAGFLAFMRDGSRDIKRDMEHGRNEVRVMTVHGAKGLEAPIVFLPDTCSAGSAASQAGRPMKIEAMNRPVGVPAPFVWPVKGTSGLDQIREAREALKQRDREERNRLLYVAMTRARDRLYIAGFENKSGLDAGCWYELIRDGLEGALERTRDADGRDVLRLAAPQIAPQEKPKVELAAHRRAAALPAWSALSVPREPQLTIPLAPSRLAPYDTDDEGEPLATPPPKDRQAEPAAASPAAMSNQSRFLRGTLTHALLQHLPSLEPKARAKAAKAFLAERGRPLPARTLASIANEAIAVLSDATFAPVFGAGSQAEVPIVAIIPRPDGDGPPLKIAGQIDRLAIRDEGALIVDFKTNRVAPETLEAVAPVYLYQLAAYRLAVREIVSGKPVRAALLWTHGPYLMEIPQEILESYAQDLWRLDTARLDA
ncbi:double-strand break repair helicase AddA [Hyphomicrobium sp.]|uniref:double-strand break repair helicase AddA n=1 Tax=Hyphomicrobium sp. TaxID=82 RepID=UPI002E30D1FA|nr:double-strand break repair helicase AddA [Hyphomicrobium sp.]HEX2843413.1 double-strand break repair helicase AddA [Hyphomicrobium sp.]